MRKFRFHLKNILLICIFFTSHHSTFAGMWSAEVVDETESNLILSTHAQNGSSGEKETVKLLVWNVYKGSKKSFEKDWANLYQELNPNIYLFQEAMSSQEKSSLCMPDSDCYMNSSFQFRDEGNMKYTGVLTNSHFPIVDYEGIHSDPREPLLSTPKCSLVTTHLIDGQEVMVINTHGINFVSVFAFERQMQEIKEKVAHFEGPMVWAGDFNTWAIGRVQILNRVTEDLSLEEVRFENESFIKKALGHRLDRVFIRGVDLLSAKALQTKASDHNPLFIEFSL
ncbi:MAG: hypothetical protein CME63_11720 [Halobacteriovoraceae bacterium]|nr:hypothetical protein [Halobacteriovoraceae bacterium]